MQNIKGIAPRVDSCAGLLVQQANWVHRNLAKEHKRWIDPEDILQDALLEAVDAEKRYAREKRKPGDRRGYAKYSTYLTRGLFYELSKKYTDRLRQKMRTSASVVELDAPLGEDDARSTEVADVRPNRDVLYSRTKRAIGALEALCRAVTPPVRIAIVSSLLLHKPVNYRKELREKGLNPRFGVGVTLADQIAAESAEAVRTTGVSFRDFEIFSEGENIRKVALIELLRRGIMGVGETDARLLECVRCSGTFMLSSVIEGWFVVSTMTCGECYRDMQRDQGRCFGKKNEPGRQGYTEDHVECRIHCIDRKVCASKIAKGDRKNVKIKSGR